MNYLSPHAQATRGMLRAVKCHIFTLFPLIFFPGCASTEGGECLGRSKAPKGVRAQGAGAKGTSKQFIQIIVANPPPDLQRATQSPTNLTLATLRMSIVLGALRSSLATDRPDCCVFYSQRFFPHCENPPSLVSLGFHIGGGGFILAPKPGLHNLLLYLFCIVLLLLAFLVPFFSEYTPNCLLFLCPFYKQVEGGGGRDNSLKLSVFVFSHFYCYLFIFT